MKSQAFVGVLLSLLGAARPVLGVTPGDRPSAVLAGVGQGTQQNPIGNEKSAVEIQANKDSSRATLSLGMSLSQDQTFSTWALTASAPLSRAGDATVLLDRDGFVNAFMLELKLTRFSAKRNEHPNWRDHAGYYEELQRKIAVGAFLKGDVKSLEDGKKLNIDSDNVLKYAPDEYSRFGSFLWDPTASMFAWGAALSSGYQSFSYLNPSDLTSNATSKVPTGARLFWGIIPPKSIGLLTLSVEYQMAYIDAKNRSIALPMGANGLQEVKSGPYGPPSGNEKTLASLEWRQLLKVPGVDKPLGVSFRSSYEFKNKAWAFDLPILLLHDPKGNLTGGLDFAWDAKAHQFSAGVIVRSAFGLF